MQYTIGYHMQNEGYPVVYPYIILMHGHPIGYPICCLLQEEDVDPLPEWIQYIYRIAHAVLRFMPTKLAEFIGENYGNILGIPPKRDQSKWNVEELNAILRHNLAMPRHWKGHLRTFGCIQWECDFFNGRPKARCYPFDLDEHRFRGGNPQVNAWDILWDIACDIP